MRSSDAFKFVNRLDHQIDPFIDGDSSAVSYSAARLSRRAKSL
ncbi:hypothetical protein EKH55_2034 [Sinorhizobium alkalisoli]|nr:hypothetical protein EKH55_2034 [Sinorhizobium alkalisoli]